MSEGQKDAGRITGLTDGEAAAIRKTAGRNTVHRGKKQNPLKLFAGQLGDLMTMILLVCAGLSVLMGEGTEALAMIVIVLVNALIGFLQEYRTERTLEALTRLAAPTARVIRQGVRREIPAEELVPGDLVLIAAGFTGCQPYVAEAFGVDLTKRGTVADTKYATNVPRVFACGDMRRGQSLVVWALREGRDTAAVVDESLMGYTNL